VQVTNGNIIKIHYKGTLTQEGTQFDSSEGREPLEFTVGEGLVIKGFDNGVLGMQVGEKKTINIPCLEAYGPKADNLVFEFPKTEIPAEMGIPEVGMQLDMMDNEGNHLPVEVIEVLDESIILDGNHQLAGKDLTFELELVAIV
jgi:peptidylprolyl isomerase